MKKFIKKATKITVMTILMIVSFAMPVMASEVTSAAADGDVIGIISNFDNLIFGIVRAVGIGFAGWGFFNLGTSFSAHDSSQRGMAIMTIVGGLVMIFAKGILTMIGAV